jgi:selenium-binding protein 1
MAMEAPAEKLAYVALLNPTLRGRHDALGIVDVDPASSRYGKLLRQVEMPNAGDELHHFGWNACSACLSPYAPHAHLERRYLIVPGLRSSRIHVIDTKPDPTKPKIVKVIEPEELAKRANYSRPHTVHCGPNGIFVSALAAGNGEATGGVFVMDQDTFDVLGQWGQLRRSLLLKLARLTGLNTAFRNHPVADCWKSVSLGGLGAPLTSLL